MAAVLSWLITVTVALLTRRSWHFGLVMVPAVVLSLVLTAAAVIIGGVEGNDDQAAGEGREGRTGEDR